MNAFQPSKPPVRPVEPRLARKHKRRRQSHVAVAVQSSAIIAANVVLSVVAVSAIVKLVPNYLTQQQKLEQIQTAVASAQGRVKTSQTKFERYFDPQQTQAIAQEQSNRFRPGQRPIVLQQLK